MSHFIWLFRETDNIISIQDFIKKYNLELPDILKVYAGYDYIYIVTTHNLYYIDRKVPHDNSVIKSSLVLSKDYHIQNIVPGEGMTCIIHITNGDVYLTTNNTSVISAITNKRSLFYDAFKLDVPHIKEVYVGYYHYVLVTTMGEIYVGGRNTTFQCGIDNISGKYISPTKFTLVEGHIIKKICTAAHNILILTNKGLFASGTNTYKIVDRPESIAFGQILKEYDIEDVWAFPVSAHIKTTDGKFYTWGWVRGGGFMIDHRNSITDHCIQLNHYLTDTQPKNLLGSYTAVAISEDNKVTCIKHDDTIYDNIKYPEPQVAYDMTVSFRCMVWSQKMKMPESRMNRQTRLVRENTTYTDISIINKL